MRKDLLIPIPMLCLLVACSTAPGPSSSVGSSVPATRRIFPPTAAMIARETSRSEIEYAMEKGDLLSAESLIDAHLDDKAYGSFIQLAKAELLARKGADAEALVLYMMTLQTPEMHWNPDSRELAPVLDLAVDLGRSGDADLIATHVIAHPSSVFFEDPSLQTPRTASTARERLAYAYLAVANDVWKSRDHEHFVKYARKAETLLPNSLPVHVQLAYALAKRRSPGDLDRARTLLPRARGTAGASTRKEIDAIASIAGIAPSNTAAATLVSGKPTTRLP